MVKMRCFSLVNSLENQAEYKQLFSLGRSPQHLLLFTKTHVS
jgi:hypothetical protein